MAKSIVISKIRCTSPNRKSSAIRNMNHLKYIATRPGVDLTPMSDSSPKASDASIYLKYISERPRSHGLFGNLPDSEIGALDTLCKKMYRWSKKKTIYQGIVSLTEEDATRLGYTTKESWYTVLKAAMPDISHELNIPIQNMKWVAAFHQEHGHPHAHYMLWREDEKIFSPFITIREQNRCREILSKYIFSADRDMAVAMKTAARNEMLDMGKELIGYVPGSTTNCILKSYPKELSEVSSLLFNLRLPTSGRLNYKFLPPDKKHEVDHVVDRILSYPAFNEKYQEYISASNKITASYSVVGKKAEHNLRSAEKDLRTRMANIIIKKIKSIPPEMLTPDENADIDSNNIKLILAGEINTSFENTEMTSKDNETPFQEKSNIYREQPYWTSSYKTARKNLYSTEEKTPEQVQEILNLLKSETRNPLALMELGKIYEKGMLGLEKKPSSASEYYAAGFKELNSVYESVKHSESKFLSSYFSYRIGKCYQVGIGTERDIAAAKNWFKVSIASDSESPNAYAQYSLAKIYMQEYNDMQKATEFYNSIENAPISLDFTIPELTDLLSSASEHTPFAAYDLASLYNAGDLVEQDFDTAQTLYAKSLSGFLDIENPDDSIHYKIGKMYADGLGTPKNSTIAAPYFAQAAAAKNIFATFALTKMYLSLDTENIDFDINALMKTMIDITNADDADMSLKSQSLYYLGLLHLKQEPAHAKLYDLNQAIRYLWQSADIEFQLNKEHFALYKLATLYHHAVPEPSLNIQKLITQLQKVGNEVLGNDKQQAAYHLGLIHLKENTEFYDPALAVKYLKQAIGDNAPKGSSAFALFKLAQLYLYNQDDNLVDNINGNMLLKLLNTQSLKTGEDELRMQATYLTALISLKDGTALYDIDAALTLLIPLAESGYAAAQASLGSFYLWGNHGIHNVKQGKMWLESAAAQNYEPALRQLEIYENILQNKLIYSSYTLMNSLYSNLVNSSRNKQAYAAERVTESIKLQKERNRKNQIRSSYLE